MNARHLLIALAAVLAAGPALAQGRSSDTGYPSGSTTAPPGGTYQGLTETRRTPEEIASGPSQPAPKPHPGKLRKFSSNNGYGPEVQFDVDRREAAEKARTR